MQVPPARPHGFARRRLPLPQSELSELTPQQAKQVPKAPRKARKRELEEEQPLSDDEEGPSYTCIKLGLR